MTETRPTLDLGAVLAAVDAAPPVAATEVLAAALADGLAAREVSFLIANFSGESLVRLGHVARNGDPGALARERGTTVALLDTPQGRALHQQRVVVAAEGDVHWLYAPVTSRGEAVGVLELRLDAAPDEHTLAAVADAGRVLAYVVIANRRFTDLFEWGQRSRPLSLEAEIQHRLLPGSYTCEADAFTLAGWLEPAGDVGGDTFDFSLERDVLHLSMTDAMGHTLEAALLATVLVGALRNTRRRGASLGEQASIADAALRAYATNSAFVTGQLARVDLRTGVAAFINAGHPLPYRVRGGAVEALPLLPDTPFGVTSQREYREQEVLLEPGDRLVFVTDGLLERNASAVDIPSILLTRQDHHPRELVQELTRAVVHACGGDLRDDATVLCVDWHGV